MEKVRPVTDFFAPFLDVILSFPVTFALDVRVSTLHLRSFKDS